MPDYHVIPTDDLDAMNEFRRFMNYAFRPTEAFESKESLDEMPGGMRIAAHRGLFEGDELLSTCAHHWFTLRIRGEWHSVPGLSAVSTPPRNRRKGLVRDILLESLDEYRERGDHFSVLWPFEHPFYERQGWGVCSESVRMECDPSELAFADEHASGEFVDLGKDDWERLDRVYAATNDQPLAMQRTEEWWRTRVFEGWKRDPYVAGWERDGHLEGYVVYQIEENDDGDGRVLFAYELGYTDHEAYLNLLRFCRYHDSQVERVRFYGPVDWTLQRLASDPRKIEAKVHPGPQLRMVDVSGALEALSYPADGDLVLAVDDPLDERNTGRFRLTVTGGVPTCTPTTDAPDVTAGMATLSQVVVGHLSAREAATTGDLTFETAGAEESLDALFPKEAPPPFLREWF